MSLVEKLLLESNSLSSSELEIFLRELLKRMQRSEHTKSIFEKYKDSAHGVWQQDAQEYVNQQRASDRG